MSSYLIAKIICDHLVFPFFVSLFSVKLVFTTNEVFEHLSMKKDPFNQIIRKWSPEGVFVDLLEKHLGVNSGL